MKAGCRVTGRRRYPAGVKDTYPVMRSVSREYPRPDGHPACGPASSLEPNAIRCMQCAAPIEDFTVLTNCWNCGSDNFLGHTY